MRVCSHELRRRLRFSGNRVVGDMCKLAIKDHVCCVAEFEAIQTSAGLHLSHVLLRFEPTTRDSKWQAPFGKS